MVTKLVFKSLDNCLALCYKKPNFKFRVLNFNSQFSILNSKFLN